MPISLPHAQKFTLYLSVLIAVSALWISGGLGAGLLAAVLSLIGLSWVWRPALSERAGTWWNALLLLFIALSVLRVVLSPAQATDAAVQLVLTLVCTKLFQRQRARDDSHLHALGFLMMALAAALDRGLGLGVVFLLYMLAVSLSLSLTHLRLSAEADAEADPSALVQASTSPPEPLTLGRGYWLLALTLGGVMLLLTSVGFLLLPRTNAARALSDSAENAGRTGLSDRVDLNRSGRLSLDDRVVMRIETPEPIAAPYWRALTLDTFDGHRWWASPRLVTRWMAPTTDTTGQFFISPTSDDAPQITQHIELEPLTRDSLISLSHPRLLQLPPDLFTTSAPPHHPHWIQIDAGGSLYQNLDHEGPLRYTVTSQPDALSPEPLSPDERIAYLQLPPDLSPRVRALAVGLTDTLTTDDARAQAVFEYVTHNHTYTLDLPARDSDPLDHFLFEDKQGHCEFFASAMVALLRLGGVPAREVLGFMGGDWNAFGGYYTVRQRDAHAWVEAHIEGRGWVMFDPTPPASRPDQRNIDSAGSWGGALMDHLQRLWGRWVVEFSLERQLGLLKSFVFGDAQRFELEAFGARLWAWTKDNALVGLSVLALLVGWWQGVKRRRWRGKHLALVWAAGAATVWSLAPESGGGVWWFLVLVGPPMALWRLRLLEVAPLGRLLMVKGREDRGQLQVFYERLLSALRQDLKVPADVLTLPPEALAQTLEQSTDPARNAAAAFVREYAALRFGPPSESKAEQRAKLKQAWRRFQRAASVS